MSSALLLTIALGVGSNAAIFGFLQGLTHPATPLKSSDRVVSIFRHDRSRDAGPLSPADYRLLESSPGVFEWIGAVRVRPSGVGIAGRSQTATVAAVTPSLAPFLAIPLDKGVVISHRVWESAFAKKTQSAPPSASATPASSLTQWRPPGSTVCYSDQSVDLWIRSGTQDLENSPSDRRDLWVLAGLFPGISAVRAQAALRSHSLDISLLHVAPFTGIAPNMAHGLARTAMFLNFSAAAVFLIACINVASFLLGRALRRSHETSLRVALGATRAELLRELFADSIVISVAGGALGLLLGILTARALPAFLFAEDAERLSFASHLLPILAASAVCVVITVACGMLPVLGTVTDRPWTVLQRETGSTSRSLQRLRSALVVVQITACCMLVISTALLLTGFRSALKTTAGERLGNPVLLTVRAQVRPDGPQIDPRFFSEVERTASSVRGLSPLAWTSRLPGNQPTWRSFRIQPLFQQYRDVAIDIDWLTPESYKLLDDPPVAGRMSGQTIRGA